MQNRVTLASVVLLVCICSTWATHDDMMVSSAFKMCRKFHFPYISSPCLTNITSKLTLHQILILLKKNHQKRSTFHDLTPLFNLVACTICKDFFGNCPENAIFQNTFLFNNWAILNISKNFFLWPNFLKCEMRNVWFEFGVVHTPCGAPGHFTSPFGCTGVSHRGFHFHLWMYGGFTQGISQEILKKKWKGRWGVCTTPNLNHTLHISHFSWCTPPDAHHRTEKCSKTAKSMRFW